MDQNEQIYNYYKSMYDSFGGNPDMQNKVVSTMYDYFNPQAVSQRKQQEDFMNLLYGTGDTASGNSPSGFGTVAGNMQNGMNPSDYGIKPQYADAVMAAFKVNPQDYNYNQIDDNASYDVPDELVNNKTQTKTQDSLNTIGQTILPGASRISNDVATNNFLFSPASVIGRQVFGYDPNQNMQSWDQSKQQYQNAGLGNIISGVKNTPFLNDLARRLGDVTNTSYGKKVLPGYF